MFEPLDPAGSSTEFVENQSEETPLPFGEVVSTDTSLSRDEAIAVKREWLEKNVMCYVSSHNFQFNHTIQTAILEPQVLQKNAGSENARIWS